MALKEPGKEMARGKAEKLKLFRRFLADRGLKTTSQREAIVDAFLSVKAHINTEELYRLVSKVNIGIGYATVHRTLKLLKDCGLATERQFGDRYTRYEPTSSLEHHDHIICVSCGEILEFENPRIEKLQEAVAQEKNYRIFRHKLELYGLCPKCQS